MAGFRLRVSPFFRKLLLALVVALIAVYLALPLLPVITSSISAARRQDKTEWSGMVDFWAS